MITFKQLLFGLRYNNCVRGKRNQKSPDRPSYAIINDSSRPVLMKEWRGMPELPGFVTEPCFGEWSWVNVLDGVALDRKIHVAVMATEVKVMFWGSFGAVKIERALRRILAKVRQQHFNGLDVTAVVARISSAYPTLPFPHIRVTCNIAATWIAPRHGDRSNVIRNGPEDEHTASAFGCVLLKSGKCSLLTDGSRSKIAD